MIKCKVKEFITGISEGEGGDFFTKINDDMFPQNGPYESYEKLSQLFVIIKKSNPSFGDVTVLLEYRPPCYQGYCDVVLLGRKGDHRHALIIELKDWRTEYEPYENFEGWIVYQGTPKQHPSSQTRGYVMTCQHTHSVITSNPNNHVEGAVFFTALNREQCNAYGQTHQHILVTDYPVFCPETGDAFITWITSYIDAEDDDFSTEFVKGHYSQSPDLKDRIRLSITKLVNDQQAIMPFTLYDKQELVYKSVVTTLEQSLNNLSGNDSHKHVFIIKGRPGTGKTAVAANLLIEGLRMADTKGNVIFTSAPTNAATWENTFKMAKDILVKASEFLPFPREQEGYRHFSHRMIQAYHDSLGQDAIDKGILENGNTYNGFSFNPAKWREAWYELRDGHIKEYQDAQHQQITPPRLIKSRLIEQNPYELTIVDEAHSLVKGYDDDKKEIVSIRSKGGWYEPIGPQAYYIIYVSKVSVFLMEEKQGLQDREVTKVTDIKRYAKELGAECHEFELVEQCRCGGSQEYIDWVDALFEDDPQKNHCDWNNQFDMEICDFPDKAESFLKEKMGTGSTARFISSFSVPWKTESIKNPQQKLDLSPTEKDFNLDNGDGSLFAKCWNTKGEWVVAQTPGIPMTKDPLCEVGYPQEVRGWDFDYLGILWLKDVIWDGKKWQISLQDTSYDNGFASQRTPVQNKLQACGYKDRRENIPLYDDKAYSVHDWHWESPKTKTKRLGPDEEKVHNLLGDNPKYIWKGICPEFDEFCDKMFRIYRILLTRAIKGNVLYIQDEKTREHIQELLKIE